MKFFVPVLIVVLPIIMSCHDGQTRKTGSNEPGFDTVSRTMDIIITDVPGRYEPGSSSLRWQRKLEQLLNLKPLQNGYDSLQVGILIDCGHAKPSSLIILETNKSQWNAIFYSFAKVYSNSESGTNIEFEINNLQTENRTPKSGWDIFSENLIKTGIIDLLDFTKYPKYHSGTDGNIVIVEVGTARKYHVFAYPDLGWNTQTEEGPGKFNQALKLIETEFNYRRPCEDSLEDN